MSAKTVSDVLSVIRSVLRFAVKAGKPISFDVQSIRIKQSTTEIVSNCLPCLNKGIPNDGFIVKLLNRNTEVQKDYVIYLTLYAALFWGEDILVSDYEYQRTTAVNEDELLYYRGIQELLSTIEKHF